MTQQTTPTQPPVRKLNLGRLERLQRLLQYGAVLVLVVFVALIALSWTELRGIYAKIDDASDKLRDRLHRLDTVNRQLEIKQQQLDAAEKARAVLAEFADEKTKGKPEEAEALSRALRNAVEDGVSESAGQQSQDAAQVVPRVYIQIMSASQRARAAQVASRLQAKGFIVPAVENMEGRGGRIPRSLVKSKPGEASATADTASINAVLGDFGVSPAAAANLPAGTRPRQYELWLGDDFVAPEGQSRPDSIRGLGTILTRPPRPNANTATAPDRKTNDRNNPRRTSP